MKITKINEKIELRNNADVELQACWNDCISYKGKSQADYNWLKRNGFKVDGATTAQIREIKSVVGFYCWKSATAHHCIYW